MRMKTRVTGYIGPCQSPKANQSRKRLRWMGSTRIRHTTGAILTCRCECRYAQMVGSIVSLGTDFIEDFFAAGGEQVLCE